MKPKLLIFLLCVGAAANLVNARGESGVRPAMILNGGDSVAAHLHYPTKARAAKDQAAISFYCEVGADGKAAFIQLFDPNDKAQFQVSLLKALQSGRFQPAMSGGKAVPVMLGGTAFFMFRGNEPVIMIALSTADKEKTAAVGNYIQPQLLASSLEFRRKMWNSRFDSDIGWVPGSRVMHPGAVVVAQVDAQGNLVSTKIVAEHPSNAGWGRLLAKAFQGAKFIPALSNGKPVAGEFDMIVNYDKLQPPDYGPATGTLIKRDLTNQ
jgi:hypothetical protein